MTRTPRRLATVLAGAALGVVALAAPASAHVEAEATPAAAGRTAVTLSVEHGCGSEAAGTAEPTTAFKVQLPDGATDVQPQDPPGWTSQVRPDQVEWSGGSYAGEGTFTLELVLAQPAGTTVVMPAVQQCPSGAEEAWIAVAEPGQPEPSSPAPEFVVPANDTTPTTAAAAATTSTTEATTSTTARMAVEATPVTVEGSQTNGAGLAVFIVVVVVILGGAAYLFLRYRGRGRV